MPLAPTIAAALTDASVRTKGLYLDGFDVLAPPVHGNRYGTPVESIEVVEEAPGQTSAMRFTIDDPASEITVAPGQLVRFADLTEDKPIFAGFIQGYRATTYGTGRQIKVECIGLEAMLDWLYVPGFTLPVGIGYDEGVQRIASAAIGIGFALNWAAPTGGGLSTPDHPVASGWSGVFSTDPCVIPSGSLRSALAVYGNFLIGEIAATLTYVFAVTVDFYGGLRFFRFTPQNGSSGRLDQGLVVLRTDSATLRPTATSYGVDNGGQPRTVYITGSGAGIGAVADGSGIVGPTAAIADANSTTRDLMTQIGQAYLGSPTNVVSGSVVSDGLYTLHSSAGASNSNRAGDYLDLLDVTVGLPALVRFPITRIAKRFYSAGLERWVIDFGGQVPSAVQYVRRLTFDKYRPGGR